MPRLEGVGCNAHRARRRARLREQDSHVLLHALQEPQCAVCSLAADAARQYLRGVLGDGVNDVDVRADWRSRGGLCGKHWRVWRSLETPALSSTVLLRDLLAHRMNGGAAAPAPGWLKARRQPNTHDQVTACPACERERAASERYRSALARIDAAQLQAALDAGRGFVCVRDLHALPQCAARDLFEARLQRLLDDLDVYLRRSDHRFAHEPMADAGDAWLRAMRALGGDV